VVRDIEDRTFRFALNVIKPSVGANVEEAEAGHIKHDFIYKMSVALKEACETHYWLRLASAAGMARKEKLDGLVSEAEGLKKILEPS
jgi:four helix bundle protein